MQWNKAVLVFKRWALWASVSILSTDQHDTLQKSSSWSSTIVRTVLWFTPVWIVMISNVMHWSLGISYSTRAMFCMEMTSHGLPEHCNSCILYLPSPTFSIHLHTYFIQDWYPILYTHSSLNFNSTLTFRTRKTDDCLWYHASCVQPYNSAAVSVTWCRVGNLQPQIIIAGHTVQGWWPPLLDRDQHAYVSWHW